MNRFEYQCVCILGAGKRTTRILNEYGKDGWELAATCLIWHYFKRPLEEDRKQARRPRLSSERGSAVSPRKKRTPSRR